MFAVSGLDVRRIAGIVGLHVAALFVGCSQVLPDRLWDRSYLLVVRGDRYLLLSEDAPGGPARSEAEGQAWFEETLGSHEKWTQRSKLVEDFPNESTVGAGGPHMFLILAFEGERTTRSTDALKTRLEKSGHMVGVCDPQPLSHTQATASAPAASR